MKKVLIALAASSVLVACGNNSTENKTDNNKTEVSKKNTDVHNITLEKIEEGPQFPDAALSIKEVISTPIEGTDSVELVFNFDVKNYELKAQTPDASSRSCNNSKDGQHIHFILNNTPYTALYEPTHKVKVPKKSEHRLLVFLSRSYHLSLKNNAAHQVLSFKIDGNGQYQKIDTPQEPMLFYSRPKGTYLGPDTENILMDFYVINAAEKLKSEEYHIIANIGGKELKINEWAPYFLRNVPMGKHSISLALMDKENKLVGDNKVQMDITLAEKEPIQP